jgi:hypothetical protein
MTKCFSKWKHGGLYRIVASIFMFASMCPAQQGEGYQTGCIKTQSNHAKYKLLSIGQGVELQVEVEVKTRFRTDDNFIAIAKDFREHYCKTEPVRIIYYRDKTHWGIRDPRDLSSTPLAIYYFSKVEGEAGIKFYEIKNGKVEWRQVNLKF